MVNCSRSFEFIFCSSYPAFSLGSDALLFRSFRFIYFIFEINIATFGNRGLNTWTIICKLYISSSSGNTSAFNFVEYVSKPYFILDTRAKQRFDVW